MGRAFLALLATLVVALALALGPRPAAGLTLRGSGVTLGSNLVTAWATTYGYDRDDVTLVFGVAGNQTAAETMYNTGLSDFWTSFVAVDASATDPQRLQIPLAAVAIVPTFRLDALGASTSLQLNATILGRIWSGQITNWNDPSLAALNAAASLPSNQPIVLVFDPNEELPGGAADAFKQALAAISPDFAAALAANGPSLSDILGAAGVTNYQLADSRSTSAGRINITSSTDGALTYALLPEIPSSGVKRASMVRGPFNNVTVTASASSVTTAMSDYLATVVNSTTGNVNVFNPPTSTAWPLTTLVFVSMRRDRVVPGKTVACQYIEETLLFMSWTQLNDKAVAVTNSLNFVGFPFGYRRKACSLLEQMTCDNTTTLTTGLIVGSGAANDVYPPLAYKYPSSSFQLKYYGSTTAEGLNNMISARFDFGIISSSLAPTSPIRTAIPDIGALPITAMAIVPIYNLPELVGRDQPLVLSLSLMGDIYLGNVTYWDDAPILALNPDLVGILPHQPIRIVYQNVFSVITAIYTKAMAMSNSAFNTTVGIGNQINFPMKTAPSTILITEINITQTVNANPYSFTPWVYNVVSSERGLAVAKLRNVAGFDVAISQESITSALNDLIDSGNNDLINAPSATSWPALSLNSIIIRQSSMTDCPRATSLLDWIYWTQNSTEALNQIVISGMGVVVNSDYIRRQMYKFLAGVTCKGQHVSSLYGCVTDDGLLCSDHGNCVNGACRCFDGYTGSLCEKLVSSSDSTDSTAIAIGIAVPLAVLVFLLLLCIILALLFMLVFRRRKRDDWEIEFNELELGSLLGTGGYGEVYKAMWKGTEVAVKMMTADSVSKEMSRNFHDEVRVMTALRHPNVVLFMAACTRPPRMAIVMEFMSLGSLFDLLHNELVPDVPHVLKVKMAYQAAKGMHFLHSSGIVHRDLKSLNLLLDAKWNLKVSDFGLTKFKAELSANDAIDVATIQWAAPEVLNESQSVDYILADVYSFGIILWELLTREQPYYGLSPAAVAVSVIRDGARPSIPQYVPADYVELMTACWHYDPTVRPTFLEVMTRLATMIDNHSNNSSSSVTSKDNRSQGSWSLPSSSGSDKDNVGEAMGDRKPPEGEVTIVFTDITRAASLWETQPSAMRDATLLHNTIVRELLNKHMGYEVLMKNGGEGSFCIVFQHAIDALEWCMEVQSQLLQAPWPKELLKQAGAESEWGDVDDRLLYQGLRVRMGVHVGAPKLVRDPMSRRYDYVGAPVNLTAHITSLAHGGQILMSGTTYTMIKSTTLAREEKRLQRLGVFDLPDFPKGLPLYELKVRGLEGRFFGGISGDALSTTDSDMDRISGTSGSDNDQKGKPLQMQVGEDMEFQEDKFLTSANLCRWIINYAEIQVGPQVGTGSYGIVYRGKWKGVDVAVKRIIKQKLDERSMLEFRAEMAFLSELHHPNIVLFIGACVQRPNLAIVTEFVKQGALKGILESNVKLPFQQRIRMLHSAALGINYLHSLSPTIIHRDIKPSNLLVDETWNVKVADFGFARIKEENATMTRCGTPAWTAPEIIRGEKYSEKADVYSFGLVMWQMLTRKQPYAGRNFMGVSLDVLEGKRPQIPQDCPPEYKKKMKKCWHDKPEKRPTMEDMIAFLETQLGEAVHDREDQA